jgi:hypothetical protein
MAKLIYAALTSLDGYTTFINDVERPIGTYLYGRRMYQTMAAWETPETIPDRTPAMLDSRGSGRRRTRSCTRGRCGRCLPPGPGSSERSTRRPYAS